MGYVRVVLKGVPPNSPDEEIARFAEQFSKVERIEKIKDGTYIKFLSDEVPDSIISKINSSSFNGAKVSCVPFSSPSQSLQMFGNPEHYVKAPHLFENETFPVPLVNPDAISYARNQPARRPDPIPHSPF